MGAVSLLRKRGVSTARGRHCGLGGASPLRGIGNLSLSRYWCPCLGIGGVTVDSLEERCQLVKPPEAKRKF